MNPFNFRHLAAAALALALVEGGLAAATAASKAKPKPKAKPAAATIVESEAAISLAESNLTLAGDSTLHKWHSKAGKMSASGTVLVSPAGSAATLAELAAKGKVKSFKFAVPVEEMKSGEKKLDKNMYTALKSKEYPEITFVMSSYTVSREAGVLTLSVAGTLTIAGAAREVSLSAKASDEAGALRVAGKHEMKMTDFGVKPPVMMLGTIRTHDKIAITYDLKLAR